MRLARETARGLVVPSLALIDRVVNWPFGAKRSFAILRLCSAVQAGKAVRQVFSAVNPTISCNIRLYLLRNAGMRSNPLA